MKELKSRSAKDWFVDSGLVLIYSFFLTVCFLIGFAHVYLNEMQTWSWISGLLVILVSPCLSYLLHNLERVIAIFLVSCLAGFALESVTSVVLFFHSFESYPYLKITPGRIERVLVSPAGLILVYTISVFFISTLGGIAGNYIAERRHKGEKTFSIRCSNCGSWNERDALKCSFCGKALVEERYAAEAHRRTA